MEESLPIYEETVRATGIAPEYLKTVVVVVAESQPGDGLLVLEGIAPFLETLQDITLPPSGAAAVVAISEPTGVMPRPKRTPKRKGKR